MKEVYIMDKINEYYKELAMNSSPEEMTKRVLAADKAKTPKRINLRRPAVIAAAAAVVMVGGVTAAATGLLNFNEIFGTIFSAESAEIGEKLVGAAENIKYTISDEDYKITLNGVSGTPASIILNFEISHTDGTPINNNKDFFIDVDLSFDGHDSSGGSYTYENNEAGNIEIEWEHRLSYESIINGELLIAGPVSFTGKANIEDNGEIKSFDWKVDFDYTPTEESLRIIKADDISENCMINSHYFIGDEAFPVECDITALTLTSSVGVIKGEMIQSDITQDLFPALNEGNDIKLIKSDGTEIIGAISSGNGTMNSFTSTIHYYTDETFCDYLAVDISDIVAISINGTVYTLS